MTKPRIAITLSAETVRYLDEQVAQGRYASRSQAVQQAVDEQIARLRRGPPPDPRAKSDRDEKRRPAEHGLDKDGPGWPEY